MSKLNRTTIHRLTLKEQFASELDFPNSDMEAPVMSNDISASVLEPWMNEPYSELMAIVAMLKALNTITQSFHWKTSGENFLGDHMLFQKVYEGVLPHIDSVGEKAVGLGTGSLSSSIKLQKASMAFIEAVFSNQAIVQGAADEADKMFRQAGFAVATFIETTESFKKELDQKGSLSTGLDNLLAGILDEHETFLYLLKQRTKQSY